MKNQLTKLALNNFRSHNSFSVEPHEKFNVIVGRNGAGKTNILEAISLLRQGRGFRSAILSELQKFSKEKTFESTLAWSVFAHGIGAYGDFSIGTGADVQRTAAGKSDKRIIKINGDLQKGQAILSRYLSVQWLVPAQDQTFALGSTSRRAFLDYLTSFLIPPHEEVLAKFEYSKSERKKLLHKQIFDDSWLKSIELKMAEYAVAIASNRLYAIEILQNAINEGEEVLFPKAMLSVEGTLETIVPNKKALDAEMEYREILRNSRKQDSESGRTTFGTHRSDFVVFHPDKNLPAELCSTGEQKAILLSIIMGSARAKKHLSRVTPILLLDEVIAHLDEGKRNQFFDALDSFDAQIWLTGTEKEFFTPLQGKSLLIEL